MKIVLVHNMYQQPGGEDVIFDQEGRMLERSGHQIIRYHRSNWELHAYQGISKIHIPKLAVWASDTYQEFSSLLQAEKPDVVHVHNTFVVISPSLFAACYKARVPIVQTLHNYRWLCPAATFFRDGQVCEECVDSSLWRSVQHGCYHDSRAQTAALALMLAAHRARGTFDREVAAFIALTEFSRSRFIKGGFAPEKVFVKRNFVYPDPRTRTGDGDYALFVGRLSPEKRVSIVLEAWQRLGVPVPLIVYGGGPDRVALENQTDELGLTNVRFFGHVPRERVLAALNNARFLIFSSQWYENLPGGIVEAFACQTPVIASRIGAMEEVVADGRTGLHFTPGDAEDLAKKVEWAWTHPEETRRMGLEARKEYESKYTWEITYPRLMQVYERAKAAWAQLPR